MGESQFNVLQDEKKLELELFLVDCCENGGISIRGECIKAKNNIEYIYDSNWEIYNNSNNNDNIILKIWNSVEVIYIEVKKYIENIIIDENELIINSVIGKIILESM